MNTRPAFAALLALSVHALGCAVATAPAPAVESAPSDLAATSRSGLGSRDSVGSQAQAPKSRNPLVPIGKCLAVPADAAFSERAARKDSAVAAGMCGSSAEMLCRDVPSTASTSRSAAASLACNEAQPSFDVQP